MRATTDFAAAREGGSRFRKQPNYPSLDPDSANRPCFQWAAADGLLPFWSPPEAYNSYLLRSRSTFSSPNDRTDTAARDAGMPAVWLCLVSNFHTNVQTKAVLLSMPRFRCVSSFQRCVVHQPSGTIRLLGSVRMEPDHRLFRQLDADSS